MQILLPRSDGRLVPLAMKASPIAPAGPAPAFNRSVYAAAHVVIDPLATTHPWDSPPAIDWEATLAFREHLYRLGFKVAEAMDTAQRGMGLDWPSARELIQRSARRCVRQFFETQVANGIGCRMHRHSHYVNVHRFLSILPVGADYTGGSGCAKRRRICNATIHTS